jgi:hypothetical protein
VAITFFLIYLFIIFIICFFFFLPSFSFFICPSYTFTNSPHPLLLRLQNMPLWATRPRRGPACTGSTSSGCTSPSSPHPRQARGSASWRLTPRGTTPCLLPWQLALPLLCSSLYTPPKSSLQPPPKSNPLHPSVRHLPSSAMSHSSPLVMAHAVGD